MDCTDIKLLSSAPWKLNWSLFVSDNINTSSHHFKDTACVFHLRKRRGLALECSGIYIILPAPSPKIQGKKTNKMCSTFLPSKRVSFWKSCEELKKTHSTNGSKSATNWGQSNITVELTNAVTLAGKPSLM